MNATLKKLRRRIQGEVLPMSEHRSLVLHEDALRGVHGGLVPENQTGSTPTCCPCADDCQD
jgi:hypothetical protein